ncbi:MAG: glycoside hydrolase family 5 protein [Acinetobacter sp.]|nr:MAG: glycoside hydrolase family 5 protein [Acinetobacter sp.]
MKALFKFVLIFFLPLSLSAQSNRFFNVKGKDIIAPNGKVIVLTGTNLGNWLIPEGYMFKFKDVGSPRMINQVFTELIGPDKTAAFWKKYLDNYITKEDIHYLKSTGMNSIRIPFHYKMFTAESYLSSNNPNRGFELLDRVIKWCKEENLPVILDMHCAPGGQTGDNIDDSDGYPFLFENPASQELTKSIWKKIALHYKDETTVIGYDLLNEPIAHYFDTKKLNPYLEPLYKSITAEVRKVDKNHLIFLGGAQWDAKAGIVTFPVPENYNLVIKYADQPKTSFADLRKYAPTDRAVIEKALNDLLERCKFSNCTTNDGYLKGLGLKTGKI